MQSVDSHGSAAAACGCARAPRRHPACSVGHRPVTTPTHRGLSILSFVTSAACPAVARHRNVSAWAGMANDKTKRCLGGESLKRVVCRGSPRSRGPGVTLAPLPCAVRHGTSLAHRDRSHAHMRFGDCGVEYVSRLWLYLPARAFAIIYIYDFGFVDLFRIRYIISSALSRGRLTLGCRLPTVPLHLLYLLYPILMMMYVTIIPILYHDAVSNFYAHKNKQLIADSNGMLSDYQS